MSKHKSHIRPSQENKPLSSISSSSELPASADIYDPLQLVRRDAHRFNLAWLKEDRMTRVQRAGFVILSSVFCIYGIYAVAVGVEEFQSEDHLFFLMLFVGFAFVALGTLGLLNVLRKKGPEQK